VRRVHCGSRLLSLRWKTVPPIILQTRVALFNWWVTQTSPGAVVTRDREAGPQGAGKPLRIGGRPVGAYLRARSPALAREVVGRLLAELPVYAGLPSEEVAGDIADIVQHNLRLFADVVEHRRAATDAELDQQRDSAAQRAEEGVPTYRRPSPMSWFCSGS
jgi:hypothetical protein